MLRELIWCVVSGRLKASGAEQPWCNKAILPAPGPGPAALMGCAGRWTTNRRDARSDLSWEVPEARCETFFPSVSNILGDY